MISPAAIGKKNGIKVLADSSFSGAEQKIARGDAFGDQYENPRAEQFGRPGKILVKYSFH